MTGRAPGARSPSGLRLAVTCGEPAGVGPEVALKALAGGLPAGVSAVLVGPPGVWAAAGQRVGVAPAWPVRDLPGAVAPDWDWGTPTPASGRVAAEAVELGARLALAGEVDALVTAPLTKEGLRAAGRPFAGHTELLEHLCGGRATMMLAGPRLRVVLVTTHLALAQVPRAVTRERVAAAARAAHRGLRDDLGIAAPRLAVLALNPHGGEGGLLGREEAEEIAPAVDDLRREGIDAVGPLPADSVFHRAASGAFDAVVAMYHDQGLGPLKLLHFYDGVNVTLGLPIVRTSPDHGTAFDLAGRGQARCDSMAEALRWAVEIARRRRGEG
ncbi:MAG: 4-hydroxythreonine-4-phosphate dehydrogenase PdxA [Deferrisomatales bacterium]